MYINKNIWYVNFNSMKILFLACKEGREENFGKGMKGIHAHQRLYILWLKEALKLADKCDWLG